MATQLILIRHGNAVRINGDYVHAPLTKLGQSQAAGTGELFLKPSEKIDALYTSPLRRAKETAALIGSKINMSQIEESGVEEIRTRELPGLILFEFVSIFDPVEDYLDSHIGKPINWPIEGRVSTVLLDLVKHHPNQRVAVVSHSGVISSVLAWLLPKKRWKWWRYIVGNCSITRINFSPGKIEVLEINNMDHLRPAIETTQPPTPSVEVVQKVHPTAKPV